MEEGRGGVERRREGQMEGGGRREEGGGREERRHTKGETRGKNGSMKVR